MADVRVSAHPLVAHHVAALRDPATGPAEFRRIVGRITRLLAVEATAGLPTEAVRVPTPLGTAPGERIAGRVAVVPILRAGLGMAEGILDLLPDAEVWHVGLYRDEATLRPQEYYNKLPPRSAAGVAIVVDPMLATGGSMVRTCEILRAAAIPRIVVMALIAAPEGIRRVAEALPDVAIHVAALDEGLDGDGFIVPGLGDAGDRQFGTAAGH
ncbi:MAG: uracil phosphoribosyltransferase [Planctomycetaceae bacterium]